MGKTEIHFDILPFCETLGDCSVTEAVRARRVPRVDIRYSRPPIYFGYSGLNKINFPVKTLAELGAGVYLGAKMYEKVTRKLPSYIKIGEIVIPVASRMVYLSQGMVGVEFIDPSREARAAIQSHFHLEFAAAYLRPVFGPIEESTLVQKITYKGKTDEYGLALAVSSGQVRSFRADLGYLGTMSWVEGKSIFMDAFSAATTESENLRAQLSSFIKNISGLNPRYQIQIIERIQKNAIEVDCAKNG